MDFRFGKAIKGFMEEHGMMDDADIVAIAGSARNLINPETQAIALRQIEISKTLHEMKEVVLMAHLDCGAYGGSKSFETAEVEYNKMTGDLKEAREVVKAKWPELSVKLWLAHIEESDHEKKIWFEEIA